MNQKYELSKGYFINRVINGCWQLSAEHCLKGELDFKDAMKAFHELVDAGYTTFDCADIYTGVEAFLGEFVNELKQNPDYKESDIQIHTKYVPDLNKLSEVDFEYTQRVIDRSLKRLNRSYLDLVQFHWWDWEVPGYMETLADLFKLKEMGKIKNIGLCNFDTKHVKEVIEAGFEVVSNQTQYSVFDRRPEKELLEYSAAHGVASLCYGTISGGLLSERWIGVTEIDPETRSHVKYMQVIEDTMGWDGFQTCLQLLKRIADKYDVSITNVATKYILSKPGVGAAIIGVRNSKHVDSNLKVFKFDLSDEDIKEIDEFVSQYPILEGDPFDLERTPDSKYRNIMKMNLSKA